MPTSRNLSKNMPALNYLRLWFNLIYSVSFCVCIRSELQAFFLECCCWSCSVSVLDSPSTLVQLSCTSTYLAINKAYLQLTFLISLISTSSLRFCWSLRTQTFVNASYTSSSPDYWDLSRLSDLKTYSFWPGTFDFSSSGQICSLLIRYVLFHRKSPDKKVLANKCINFLTRNIFMCGICSLQF